MRKKRVVDFDLTHSESAAYGAKCRCKAVCCAIAAVAFAALLALSGCAAPQQDTAAETEPKAEVTEQQADVEAGDAFPATCFSTSTELSDGKQYKLFDMEGNEIKPDVEDARFIGPFSGGFIVGVWDTEEYDEKFKTTYDERRHLGLFDSEGKLSIELTDTLASKGVSETFSIVRGDSLRCEDGRLVVPVLYEVQLEEPGANGKKYEEHKRAFVFDQSGNVVFEFEFQSSIYNSASNRDGLVFHDGILVACNSGASADRIYDVNGTILAEGGDQFTVFGSCGNGYYSEKAGNALFYSYDGSLALDPESLNVDDIVNANGHDSQPQVGGLAYITAEEKNPHESGLNLELSGLYDLAGNEWVFPLSTGFECKTGYDGVLPVSLEDESSQSTASSSEKASDGSSAKLVDAQGQTIFDISTLAEELPFKFIDGYEYLHDGYWMVDGFSYETSKCVVVYIEDGEYKGYTELDYNPSPL